MEEPFLSIVVPALNEAGGIASFISRMRAEIDGRVPSWEMVVADDGSADATRAIVEACGRDDERIRLSPGAHGGKGAALRRGLLAARGRWRFMADADLSMPPDNIWRFLARAGETPEPAILIGSREAPDAVRVGEPWRRHAAGRVFNWLVQVLAVPGLNDTQCGYKLLSAAAAERVLPRLTIDGFAFDVEMLLVARHLGVHVREVGIVWHARADSRVRWATGAGAFADLLRIHRRWGRLGDRQVPAVTA
jgi:dolichyl-phosphate beta-glucosyltransferase